MPHRHDLFVLIVSAHDGYPRRVDSGADFIEIDIRRDAQGVFILSHDEPRPGFKYPTLHEVLERARGKIGIQLDLKESDYEDELIDEALTVCPIDRLVVTTGSRESIAAIKAKHPQVRAGLTRSYVEQTDADFLALDQQHADEEALAFCELHSIALWVWTVDDKRLMRRFIEDRRIAGLITNKPERALKLRKARS
jgi:glycerophosphoryl diester phosphodiesterase